MNEIKKTQVIALKGSLLDPVAPPNVNLFSYTLLPPLSVSPPFTVVQTRFVVDVQT